MDYAEKIFKRIRFYENIAAGAVVVLLLFGALLGSYKTGYNKGLLDMAKYAVEQMKHVAPSLPPGDDETGNVGHF